MSRQIADVVLFFSKFSRESGPCVEAVIQSKLPIKLVPLDTVEAREAAQRGTAIQIRAVPSLVVELEDGNVQMYVGRPKILAWLKSISQSRQPPPQPTTSSRNSSRSGRNTKLASDSDDQSDESESDDSPPPPRKKSPRKKSSPKKKKIKKQATQFVESPVDLEFADDPPPSRPPPLSTSGLSTSSNSGTRKTSDNLMNMAKQMMADRDSTLGYKADADS